MLKIRPLDPTALAALAAATVMLAAAAAQSEPLRLSQVRSFEYMIAARPDQPGFAQAVERGSPDMLILSSSAFGFKLDRSALDPSGRRLFLRSVDTCEAMACWYPELFAGGKPAVDWIGKAVPGYADPLYTVQFWNPEWKPRILRMIDRAIEDGYDGAFLDVLDGDANWAEGNRFGNPVYPGAREALVALLSDIRAHVDGKRLGRPFYLVGNNPSAIGRSDPSALGKLDGIFNEVAFWRQTDADATKSARVDAGWLESSLAPLYASSGLPVFGNDYPSPLEDREAVIEGFALYSRLGWVSSATNALQDARILSTGPFLRTAVPGNPRAEGVKWAVNYLSGGACADAVLVGGDRGDVLMGGPGRNLVSCGAGDDLVYAHPASVAPRNRIEIVLYADAKGAPDPELSVLVDGAELLGPRRLEAGKEHRLAVDAPSSSTVSSIEIRCRVAPFVDMRHFANLQLRSVRFMGVAMPLASGEAGPDSRPLDGGKALLLGSSRSFLRFGPAAIPKAAASSEARDEIDGGGGSNAVVYRRAKADYSIERLPDGSVVVSARDASEGPDRLRRVQELRFADGSLSLERR